MYYPLKIVLPFYGGNNVSYFIQSGIYKTEWKKFTCNLSSVQFSPVAQLCLTLCDPTNCSMPGLPVHHQLPEFTQTHAYLVDDAIQPSHPVFPFSYHLLGLFK